MFSTGSFVRHARRPMGAAAGAVAVLLLLSACGSKNNGNVTIGNPNTKIVVSNSNGNVVIGGNSLPDGFPSGFPIPEGSTITFSANEGASGRQAFEVVLSLTQDGPTAFNYFLGALASAGYVVNAQTQVGSGAAYTATIGFQGNGYDGAVVLGPGAAGATTASITLTTFST